MVAFDFVKSPITKIVDAIIIESSKSGASDIHFDPRENGMMVRRRIDGELMDYTFIPKVYERNLTTRLKLMSGMNITESRLPQDGAIKGKFGEKDLDMRVSCLPTNEGEKIVIRILDYSKSLDGIEELGFNDENFVKLKNMIAVPNGIILITGATGSGKSTTSYSILQVLNKEETNVITVEDPIEMNIEGLNQVQVNSEIGLDFATVLRSILRQDPNVILIGEIRDSETAKIAVRASITGHLVISTIHTNNSLSTIERLLDMDVERYLLSTALTGIISQRLAKTVCQHCKITRKASPYEKKVFKLALNKDIDEIIDANHDGCEHCNKGYRGRIAIQEVLEIDDFIRAALNNPEIDKEELKELVYGSGNVITLLQDGLRKILDGSTTFEEIYRIIEIDNDINDSCYISDTSKLSEDERLKIEEERSRELSELKKMREVSNANVATSTTSIVQPTDAKNVSDILPVVPSNLNATNNVVPNVDQVVINIDNNESDNKSVSDITPIETEDIVNSLIPEVPNNLEIKE
ncbi:MAG: type II/IV secretion system protein [Bacilli bacterium]|nr:type II/IV secretion system protein [Bacilli bacterium]